MRTYPCPMESVYLSLTHPPNLRYPVPRTGGLSPLTWESCSPESEACFSSPIRFFYLIFAQFQRGNSRLALLRGNSQPRTLDLARDVMQLHCTSSLHGRHHPAGIRSLLPDPDYTCSHDVTLRIPKCNPRSPRGSLREHMCSAHP